MILPSNYYRVEKMSIYDETTNLQVGKAKKLGTLGTTKVFKKKYGLFFTHSSNKIMKKYNIKFVREYDRLVFSGKFKKSDKVRVVLYKNFIANYYDVKISRRPYTALCVDVFTDEEAKNGVNITKYINNEALSGKYFIYLEINGKLYNINRYTRF